jgi:hypothetical protein
VYGEYTRGRGRARGGGGEGAGVQGEANTLAMCVATWLHAGHTDRGGWAYRANTKDKYREEREGGREREGDRVREKERDRER